MLKSNPLFHFLMFLSFIIYIYFMNHTYTRKKRELYTDGFDLFHLRGEDLLVHFLVGRVFAVRARFVYRQPRLSALRMEVMSTRQHHDFVIVFVGAQAYPAVRVVFRYARVPKLQHRERAEGVFADGPGVLRGVVFGCVLASKETGEETEAQDEKPAEQKYSDQKNEHENVHRPNDKLRYGVNIRHVVVL